MFLFSRFVNNANQQGTSSVPGGWATFIFPLCFPFTFCFPFGMCFALPPPLGHKDIQARGRGGDRFKHFSGALSSFIRSAWSFYVGNSSGSALLLYCTQVVHIPQSSINSSLHTAKAPSCSPPLSVTHRSSLAYVPSFPKETCAIIDDL